MLSYSYKPNIFIDVAIAICCKAKSMNACVLQVLITVVVLVAAVHIVSGLPGGAPLGACVSLTPSHGGNAPQNAPSPHIVNLSSFDAMFNESTNITTLYYIPDTMYPSKLESLASYQFLQLSVLHNSVTLEATGVGLFSNIFRGFLLQGRAYADDSVVGAFMAPSPDALYRLSDCERSNVSH